MIRAELKRRFEWRYAKLGDSYGNLDMASRARFAMYAWGGVSLLGLCLSLVTRLPNIDRPGMLAVSAAGMAVALTLMIGFDRLPSWTFPASTALAVVLIAPVLYFTHRPASPLVILYVPVIVAAFYFHGAKWGAVQNLLIAVTYGAVLAIERPEGAIPYWALTVGILVLTGNLIERVRDRIEQLVAELDRAARTDPLTGLLNRRAFNQEFEMELERSRRSARPMSLMMADVDHFKRVNDELGHGAGDEALKQMAALFQDVARRVDSAVRMGGEEFALLLPGTDEAGAYMLAERVRSATRHAFADQEVHLTISFGIASYPAHGYEIDALMRAADHALYTAKALGRDRTVVCSHAIASAIAIEDDRPVAPEGGRAAA